MSIADIFREAIRRDEVRASYADWKIINDILRCRTPELGGHLYTCTDCGHGTAVYNSCRNRHCPQCQGEQSAKWLEARAKELLPVPYFHNVFTVPHELNGIFLQNRSILSAFSLRRLQRLFLMLPKEGSAERLGFSRCSTRGANDSNFIRICTLSFRELSRRGTKLRLRMKTIFFPRTFSPLFFAPSL